METTKQIIPLKQKDNNPSNKITHLLFLELSDLSNNTTFGCELNLSKNIFNTKSSSIFKNVIVKNYGFYPIDEMNNFIEKNRPDINIRVYAENLRCVSSFTHDFLFNFVTNSIELNKFDDETFKLFNLNSIGENDEIEEAPIILEKIPEESINKKLIDFRLFLLTEYTTKNLVDYVVEKFNLNIDDDKTFEMLNEIIDVTGDDETIYDLLFNHLKNN